MKKIPEARSWGRHGLDCQCQTFATGPDCPYQQKWRNPWAWSPGAQNEMKIVIDCSPPPSTNRLWRYGKGHVYRSPEYEKWRSDFFYEYRRWRPRDGSSLWKIDGSFDAEILVSSKRRDVDNNAKALLDICEDLGIIKNDKLARKVTQERVEKDRAPQGCRLILIALEKEDEQEQIQSNRASKRKLEKKAD